MKKYLYINNKIKKMSFKNLLRDFRKCSIKTKYNSLKNISK